MIALVLVRVQAEPTIRSTRSKSGVELIRIDDVE